MQINISRGGMPKHAVLTARVTVNGIEGDRQKNRKYHGGPDRAICLYSEELYAQLQSQGVQVYPGDLGENFTTAGLDLQTLSPGLRLSVGACQIEITAVRIPCRQLNAFHPRLHKLIEGRSGWMARVVEAGMVKPGDEISEIRNPKSETRMKSE